MNMQIIKAVRKRVKLRLALTGPANAGKTYGALLIAKGLGGRVGVIDTERDSASLYAHLMDFDVINLSPPYTPEVYIEAIHTFENAGYDVIIIDSMTHEWDGAGGILEANERIAATKFKGNTWSAWSESTPRHQAFIDSIIQSKAHVIATLRSKVETVQEGGRVKKLGMKPVTREGTDYEFTAVFELDHSTKLANVTKNRMQLPDGKSLFAGNPFVITENTGKQLMEWLNIGSLQTFSPPPQMTPAAPTSQSRPATVPSPQEIEKRANELVAAITSCESMEDLKSVWTAFVIAEWKSLTPDEHARLNAVKDSKKAEIAARSVEAVEVGSSTSY